MRRPRFFVKDGHTLGHVYDELPGTFGILRGSGLLGGHDWKNGSVPIDERSNLRPATLADFEAFRVCPDGYVRDGVLTPST